MVGKVRVKSHIAHVSTEGFGTFDNYVTNTNKFIQFQCKINAAAIARLCLALAS